MAINCPQCGQAMSEIDATQAQCAKHGPYTILFKRSAEDDGTIPLSTMTPPVPRQVQPVAYAQQYVPYAHAIPAQQLGPCQNHQQVAAVQCCTRCSARVCSVCDFIFPGDIYLCPRCVTSSAGAISPGRRGMMIAAYCTAGGATLLFVLLMLAAAEAFGIASGVASLIFLVLLGACSITGLGLGLGTIDRTLNNPVSLWIAALWNGVLALLGIGFWLLFVVGLLNTE